MHWGILYRVLVAVFVLHHMLLSFAYEHSSVPAIGSAIYAL